MKLTIGKYELEMGGKYLGALRDANASLHESQSLQARMEEDGYLLIRGLHDREKVNAAREMLLASLDQNGQISHKYPLKLAVPADGARGGFLGGSKATTRDPAFLNLVESPEVMGFFARFLQGNVLTFDYKWLRVVGPGDFTGAHYDIVYMGRGTQNLYTC